MVNLLAAAKHDGIFDVLPGDDPVPDKLPPLFRITSIERFPGPNRQVRHRASLFHEKAGLSVEWCSQHVDARLAKGSLVSIRWAGRTQSIGGHVQIARLVLLELPEAEVNLFHLVPYRWVRDRELVARAALQWEGLPRGFRHLFNAIFWDGQRFQRYLVGPSSLENHHNGRNGNFRHSVEVAERALLMAEGQGLAHHAILALGGLIHDAGKADDYRFDYSRQCFTMSDRGALIGHRDTLQQWIAAAMAKHRVILPEVHYLGLIHALTAAKGAPQWLGLREPRSLEATILSMADRLSGEEELYGRLAPVEDGFGRYHPHLRGRPFVSRMVPRMNA
ncbi:HD domain-containing protein [Rhodocyclus tenuis]|uniref:HD domain-containing protein n=1 Tax=Rhodocyclus gracilis TaxID=2929842 RepID=A0ABX0WLI7_9RHOO|nr:HD domain-containing protein [Rhodocyclus gracilis]NJA89813.1 HD domain-containing protein [Rhodocyclus gracilis]